MDLFQPLPMLRRQPLLRGKAVSLIGVSAIVSDDEACTFEIAKPHYWLARADGTTSVGIGAIGGSIEQGETLVACLRREVQEEIGARVSLETPGLTYLIRAAGGAAEGDWQVADAVEIAPSKKRPVPWMVLLFPPRLGGPGTPDLLAICAFRTRLSGRPEPHDLFGLLRIRHQALGEFFARDEWPVGDLPPLSGLEVRLNGAWPTNPVLRPVLTARAFQLLVRAGYA